MYRHVKVFSHLLFVFCMLLSLGIMTGGMVFADNKAVSRQAHQASAAEKSLNAARDQLQLAFSSFRDKQFEQTQKYLLQARELLDDSALNSASQTVQSEARNLVDEIEAFEQKLAQGADQKEGSIARFWRRATSFIRREAEQLVHQYVALSQNEKTFKHLLDAKMHLFIAEHDLFVSHDARDAYLELDKVLKDLALAQQQAVKEVLPEVEKLSAQVTALREKMNRSSESWLDNEVLMRLQKATEELLSAEQTAQPDTSMQIGSIRRQIDDLRKEVETINLRTDYDKIMKRIKMIIEKLESE